MPFKRGQYLLLTVADGRWDEDKLVVRVTGRKVSSGADWQIAKVVWRMGRHAEEFDYGIVHVGGEDGWRIEVIGAV